MAAKEKQKTEAELEPGFFSDYGYGNGTAITITHEPTEEDYKEYLASKRKK